MDLPSFSDDPCYFYWLPDSSGQVYPAKEGNVITKFVADFVQWEHKAGNEWKEFRIEEEEKSWSIYNTNINAGHGVEFINTNV